MKKMLLIFTIASFLVIGFSFGAQAGSQDFTLVNYTGVDIYQLYITDSGADNWGNDILGNDILKNGASTHITFTDRYETYWDIMIKDKVGNRRYWKRINLKIISKIYLHMSGNTVWFEWE